MSTTLRPAPGPQGKWLTGNLTQLFGRPHEFMEELRKYPDMCTIRLLGRSNIVVTNPDLIKEVLVTKQHSFIKPKVFKNLKPFVGEGLLTSDGELHKRQRAMIQPHFTRQHIGRYAKDMTEIPETYMEDWRDGEERDILQDTMNIALGIITKTMFSMDLYRANETIGKPMDTCLQMVSKRMRALIRVPSFIPTKDNRTFGEALGILDEFIHDLIEERKKSSEDYGDLMAVLMAARDETDGSGMSEKQLRDEMLTVFLAGHETTANTLAWVFDLLSRHPEAERKLHEELDRVLGGRLPELGDFEKLTYTQNIIWETLRMYPSAWLIARTAAEDVRIGDYLIKKGEEVMTSPYLMHRHSRYFPEPDRFRPERFENGFVKTIPQFAYFPFGGGARVCIGNHFAMLEATLVLAAITRRFTLKPAPGVGKVEPQFMITLRPKGGVRMTVHRRHPFEIG